MTPKNLDFLSTANVSGSVQDNKGAIWLNSNRGFFRYNGQSAEYFGAQIGQTNLLCDSAGHIYAMDQEHVRMFDSNTLQSFDIAVGEEDNLHDAAMAVRDSALFVGIGNRLYKIEGMNSTLVRTFGRDITVRSLAFSPDGRLLIGTDKIGLITIDSETIIKGIGSIRTIATTPDGTILIGTQDSGLYKLSYGKSENIGRGVMYNIRSVVKENDGDYLIGTPDGLYRLSKDGILSKERIDGVTSCPICNFFKDKDDNLWISTYYNGLLLSGSNSTSYQKVDTDKEIQNIKCLAKDSRGNVYLTTDGNGIWVAGKESANIRLIRNTEGYKFQCAWYDEIRGIIWASDFKGKLLSIDPCIGVTQSYDIGGENPSQTENILSIRRAGEKLYMAGLRGIYTFDPTWEKTVTNMIEGLDRRVFDIEISENGTIWAAGYGLYRIEGGHAVKEQIGGPKWTDESTISDIEEGNDGTLWLAYFRRGAICKKGEEVWQFNKMHRGLIDEYCINVIPLETGKALVSTGREISEISVDGSTLRFPVTKTKRLIKLDDGRVFAAGNDGIMIIDAGKIKEDRSHGISIDKFSINDKRFDGRVLSPEQTGFSFEVTTFDYTETVAESYFCRLKGFEEEWKRFDLNQPVNYMNMKPGKYTFEVESRNFSLKRTASDTFTFRIRPHWWNTPQAYILFALILLTILAVILYFLYMKRRLTEEISLKDKENREKTLFFISLSYQLRTPLNLAIGNLERFFNKYGARTAGIENIEDVYNKAKEMRELISEYVDKRNGQAGGNEEPESIAKDAKFLNAAIGVVERNLFSPDLNVSLLCAELNMGKTNLTKRIKDTGGMTPRAFIEDIKLKHAAQMISDGTYRVSEIADLLNFSSTKYFSQRFKLQYGITPKDYNKKSQ